MNQFKNPALAGTGSACLEKPEYAFLEATQAAFGRLDFLPLGDGTLHRFHIPGDKPGTLNGWYVLYLDGLPSGAFGSWKTGQTHTWSIYQPSSPIEAELIRQRMEHAKAQRLAEQQQRHQQAAETARSIWQGALPANPYHPYLVAKGVTAHHLRQNRQSLLVPLYAQGQLVNLQFIQPDGSKRFLSGGQVKGAYSPIGQIQAGSPLYIAEGWATGATLHQHTGSPVACAMNAGNLLAVGKVLRAQYPDLVLILAGDDDRQTEGNPGRSKAIAAANHLGCSVVFPAWPADAPLNLSDFNDLNCWIAGGAV